MLKELFFWFLNPKGNRYLAWGLGLSILGVILIPFIIGIPLAGIGFSLFSWGVMVSFAQKFSKGEKVVGEVEKMFARMGDFFKKITHTSKG